jgi:hypothetical protein
MTWDINWHVAAGDPVLTHPTYLRFSTTPLQGIERTAVVDTLNAALASNEASGVIAYLCWLLRVKDLLAGV